MADQSETHLFGADKSVKDAENENSGNQGASGSPFGEQSSSAGFSGFPDLSDLSALESGSEFWSPWSPGQEPIPENNSKPLVGDLFSSLSLDPEQETASCVAKDVSEMDGGGTDKAESLMEGENNSISQVQSSLVDVDKCEQFSTPVVDQSVDDDAELHTACEGPTLDKDMERGYVNGLQGMVKEKAIDTDFEQTADEIEAPEVAYDREEPETAGEEQYTVKKVTETVEDFQEQEIASDFKVTDIDSDVKDSETIGDLRKPESVNDIQELDHNTLHPSGYTDKEQVDQYPSRQGDEVQGIDESFVQTSGKMEEQDQNILWQPSAKNVEHTDQYDSVKEENEQTIGTSLSQLDDRDLDHTEDKIEEQDHEIQLLLPESDLEKTTSDNPHQLGDEGEVIKGQRVIGDTTQSAISDLDKVSYGPIDTVEEQMKNDDKLQSIEEQDTGPHGEQAALMEVEPSTAEQSSDQSKTKASESKEKATGVPNVECINISSDEEERGVRHKTSPVPPVSRNIVINSAKGVEKVIGTASIDTGGEKVDMQELKSGDHNVTVFFVKKNDENKSKSVSTTVEVEDKSKAGGEPSSSCSSKATSDDRSNMADDRQGRQSNQHKKTIRNVPKHRSSGSSGIGYEIKALMMSNKSTESVSNDDDIIIDQVISTSKISKTAPSKPIVPKPAKTHGAKISNVKYKAILPKPGKTKKSAMVLIRRKGPGRPRNPGPISAYLKKKYKKEALEYVKRQRESNGANVEGECAANTTSSLALDVESHPDEMMQSIVQSCVTPSKSTENTVSTPTSSSGLSNPSADANKEVITLDISDNEDKEDQKILLKPCKFISKSRQEITGCGNEGDSSKEENNDIVYKMKDGQTVCQFCSKTFPSFAAYSRHVVIHFNLKSFLCRICEQMFSDSSTLVKHLRIRHFVKIDRFKDFVCSYCKKNFDGPQNLLRHVMVHTGKTLPAVKKTTKEKKRELKEQKRIMKANKRRKKEKMKLAKMKYKQGLTVRMESESAKRASDCEENDVMEIEEIDGFNDLPECAKMFDCSQCDLSCTDAAVFIEHVKTQHSSKIQLQCPLCSTMFIKISSFVSHLKFQKCTQKKELHCASCEFQGEDATDLAEHVMNFHTLCHLCKKEFSQLELLQRHLTLHLKIRPFKCNKCGAAYGDSTSYITHMVGEHPKSGVDYQCYKCNVYFSRAAELTRHLFQHITLEDFEADPSSTQRETSSSQREQIPSSSQCSRCCYVYKSVEEAEVNKCKNKGIYQCKNCPSISSYKGSLNENLKICAKGKTSAPTMAIYSSPKNDTPEVEIFKESGTSSKTVTPPESVKKVSTDVQSGTPKKTKVFRCTKCNFISSDTNAHVQHVMTKHNAKNIQYQCHLCKMLFTSPKDLVQHIDTHRNKGPKTATSQESAKTAGADSNLTKAAEKAAGSIAITKIVSSPVKQVTPSSKPGITILTSVSPVRRVSTNQQQQSSTLASTVIKNLSNLAQADCKTQPQSVVSTASIDYSKMPALGAITKLSQIANKQQHVPLAMKSAPPTVNVIGGTWAPVGSNNTTSVSTMGNIVQCSTTSAITSSVSSLPGNKHVLYVKAPNSQAQKNSPMTYMLPPPILLPSSGDKGSTLQRSLTLPPIIAPTGTNIQLRIMSYQSQQSTSNTTTVTQSNISQSSRHPTTQATVARQSAQSTSCATTVLTQANQSRPVAASVLQTNPITTIQQASRLDQNRASSTSVQPHPQPSMSTDNTGAAMVPATNGSDNDSDSSYEDHRFVRIKEEPVSDNEDTSRDMYKCDICQIEFVQASALQNHQTLLHNNKEENTANQTEVLDNEALSSFATTRNESNSEDSDSDDGDVGFHYTVSESDSDRDNDDTAYKPQNPTPVCVYESGRKCTLHKCRFESCKKIFRGSHNLFRHLCIHTKLSPFQCYQCKQNYRDTSYYIKHLRTAHQAERVTYSCKYCGLNHLKTPKELIQHMTTTHSQFRETSQFYVCVHCNCLVQNAKHLQNHIRALHDRRGLSHCYFCKKTFTQSVELPLHLHLAHLPELPFQCTKCPFKTAQVPSYTAHMQREHNLEDFTYTCPVCFAIYCKSGDLIQHELIHAGRTIKLQDACGIESIVTHNSPDGYNVGAQVQSVQEHEEHKKYSKHKKKDNREKIPSRKVAEFLCNFCFQEFPSKELLHLHIWDHNAVKPYRCYKCKEEFSIAESYMTHVEGFHQSRLKFVCFFCNKSFTQWPDLLQHYTEKHGSDLISCCKCPRTFDSLDRLNRHFHVHSVPTDKADQDQQPIESKQISQSILMGPQVGKTVPAVAAGHLTNADPLENNDQSVKVEEREMKTEQNELEEPSASQEPLPACRFCKKEFPKNHQIVRHEKIHYKPFVCNIRWCLKRFGEKCQLEKHTLITHKQKCCHYCVSSFRTIKELNEHQAIHKNMPGNGFSCVYCTRSFQSFEDLVLHSDVVLAKYTNMTCYICKERLTLPCQMLVHQEIHQANRQCKIQCNFCDTSHYSIIDFNKHRKQKHGVTSLLDVDDIVIDDRTGDKECHFCFRICHTPKRMKIHLVQDHSVNEYLALCMTKTLWKNIDSQQLNEQLGSIPQLPPNFQLTGDDYDEEDDEDEDEDDDDDDGPSGGLTCKFCSAKFTDVGLLKTHEAAHSGKTKHPAAARTTTTRGHECKKCGFAFTTEKDLQEHAKAHISTDIDQDTSKILTGIDHNTSKSPANIDQDVSKTVESKEASKEVVDSSQTEEAMSHEKNDCDDNSDGGSDIMDFTEGGEGEIVESEKEKEKKDGGCEEQEETKKKFACPFCDVKSSSKHNLMKHIMSHAGQEVKHGGKLNVKVQMSFKCDQCSASFKYREMLKKHKRKHFHEEGLIYKCSVCSKEFNHIAKYYQHKMAAHSKKEAGFGTKHKRSVGRPRKYPEIKSDTGEHGKDDGQNFKEIANHRRAYLSYFKYSCEGCGRKFRKSKRLHEHQTQCHKLKTRTDFVTQQFEDKQQEVANTSDIVLESLPSDNNPTADNVPSKKAPRPSGYVGISATSSVARGWIYPHKCKQCSALFRKKKALNRHMIHMHLRFKTPQVKQGDEMKHQKSSRYTDKTLVKTKKNIESSKPWKCVECGERFFREVSLLRHLPVHKSEKGEKTVKGHERTEKPMTAISRHNQAVIGSSDSQKTPNESVKNQSKPKEIVPRTSGESSKQWKCDTCGERFFREVSLLRHLPMHDKEKDKQEQLVHDKEKSKQTKEFQASKIQERLTTSKPDLSKSLSDVSKTNVSPDNKSSSKLKSGTSTIEPEPTLSTKTEDEVQIPDEVKNQLYDVSIPVIKSSCKTVEEELRSTGSQDDTFTHLRQEDTDDESTMSTCTDESLKSMEEKMSDMQCGLAGGLSSIPEQSAEGPVWIYKYYCKYCQAPFAKASVYQKHLRRHTRKNKSKKKQGGQPNTKGQSSDNIEVSQEIDGKSNEKTDLEKNNVDVSESGGNSDEPKQMDLQGDADIETDHEQNTTSPNVDLSGTFSTKLSLALPKFEAPIDILCEKSKHSKAEECKQEIKEDKRNEDDEETSGKSTEHWLDGTETDKISASRLLSGKPSATILEDCGKEIVLEEDEELKNKESKESRRKDLHETSISQPSKRPVHTGGDGDEILFDNGISSNKRLRGTPAKMSGETEVCFSSSDVPDEMTGEISRSDHNLVPSSEESTPVKSSLNKATMDTQVITKRGRGRPRGTFKKRRRNYSPKDDARPSNLPPTDGADLLPKRGRGRPRGTFKVKILQEEQEFLRRPRGRPRKNSGARTSPVKSTGSPARSPRSSLSISPSRSRTHSEVSLSDSMFDENRIAMVLDSLEPEESADASAKNEVFDQVVKDVISKNGRLEFDETETNDSVTTKTSGVCGFGDSIDEYKASTSTKMHVSEIQSPPRTSPSSPQMFGSKIQSPTTSSTCSELLSIQIQSPSRRSPTSPQMFGSRMRSPPTSPASPTMLTNRLQSPPRKILFKGGNLKIEAVNVKKKSPSPEIEIVPAKRQLSPDPTMTSVYDFDEDDEVRSPSRKRKSKKKAHSTPGKKKLGKDRFRHVTDVNNSHTESKEKNLSSADIEASSVNHEHSDNPGKSLQDKQDEELLDGNKLPENTEEKALEIEDDLDSDATIENYFQDDDSRSIESTDISSPKQTDQGESCVEKDGNEYNLEYTGDVPNQTEHHNKPAPDQEDYAEIQNRRTLITEGAIKTSQVLSIDPIQTDDQEDDKVNKSDTEKAQDELLADDIQASTGQGKQPDVRGYRAYSATMEFEDISDPESLSEVQRDLKREEQSDGSRYESHDQNPQGGSEMVDDDSGNSDEFIGQNPPDELPTDGNELDELLDQNLADSKMSADDKTDDSESDDGSVSVPDEMEMDYSEIL